MKSKVITLSAVSAALTALCLTIGVYMEIADIFCVICSSVFVLLPLYYNSYKGCFLVALAGGVLALFFSWFNFLNIVFPTFFVFFGIYPIVRCYMRDKKFNKILGYIIGAIWCVAVVYGAYFYYTLIIKLSLSDLPAWFADNILIFIGVLGAIFFAVYDRFIYVLRIFSYNTLCRIIK